MGSPFCCITEVVIFPQPCVTVLVVCFRVCVCIVHEFDRLPCSSGVPLRATDWEPRILKLPSGYQPTCRSPLCQSRLCPTFSMNLDPPVVAFSPLFWGRFGSPKLDYREKWVPTYSKLSNLEDLEQNQPAPLSPQLELTACTLSSEQAVAGGRGVRRGHSEGTEDRDTQLSH